MNTTEKLHHLRQLMKQNHLDAFIIPSSDPHLSEYTPKHWQTRAWLTGFTGSAGTAVVTLDDAGLWTDARYHIQADIELAHSGFRVFKMGNKGVPSWNDWLINTLPQGSKVGCLGTQLSATTAALLRQGLQEKEGTLELTHDLIGQIWQENRPPMPTSLIREQTLAYAGKSREDKLADLRTKMQQLHTDWYFSANLDSVSWLLNVRADDILYCPFATSYVLVGSDCAYWFVNPQRVNPTLTEALSQAHIEIKDYAQIIQILPTLIANKKVYLTPAKVNALLAEIISQNAQSIEGRDIISDFKAIKNKTEIANFHRHYRDDGVALVKFYCWLEHSLAKKEPQTEISIAEHLSACRLAQPDSCGDSFATIAAYGSHAAMCHYSATPASSATLEPKGLLLIDSGGQYLGATTDITRTIALGECTQQEKIDYTLVLKGHIAVSKVHFLAGCSGSNIDILARLAMWEKGIDFKHGTGHGVGNNLSVHEGPQSISLRSTEPIRPGMVITVEPGIYREDQHGIRSENVVYCQQIDENEFGTWLAFTPLTLCPFDTQPLLLEMLTTEEKNWLNDYHQRVYNELSPFLTQEEKTWLAQKTAPVA